MFLSKRSNRSFHHSSNFLFGELPPLLKFLNWLPGSDSNARIRIQSPESCRWRPRICFMHRTTTTAELIYVGAKPPAITAALTVKVRCKLDLKAFEFNRVCTHNFGSSEENRTPISALKEPYPGL